MRLNPDIGIFARHIKNAESDWIHLVGRALIDPQYRIIQRNHPVANQPSNHGCCHSLGERRTICGRVERERTGLIGHAEGAPVNDEVVDPYHHGSAEITSFMKVVQQPVSIALKRYELICLRASTNGEKHEIQ